jgi:tight adherence protein B
MLVVTAIIINSQVGGNLSLVLSSAIETIRERLRLFGEVRSLTAYARFVGNFISLLPVIAALLIYLVNPGYFETLGTSIITQIIFVLAIIGVIIGNIVIRQIVKIKV